jgi:CxC5 like cysteine cluster associated with KDZ transposases
VKFFRYLVKPHVMVVSTLVWLLLCLALQLFISVTGPTAAGFINVLFLAGFSLKSYTLATSPISWLLVWLAFVPCVLATGSTTTPFPNIPFQAFSQFILTTFNPEISLGTVLLVFFSLLENPDLLNLHARQKHPKLPNEKKIIASSWMKSLGRALDERLDSDVSMLFQPNEFIPNSWETPLALKLDAFSELLQLTPYKQGVFNKKLQKVSLKAIEPIPLVCPIDMECTTASCKFRHIGVYTRQRDIPLVTLIKGSSILKNVAALTGECTTCHSMYYADHQIHHNRGSQTEIFLNSAKYLQIGSNIWVDTIFSNALLNGMYSFHASANTYTQYWNNSFGAIDPHNTFKISRKQVWQAFVQHSIRDVASISNTTFETQPNIAIDDLTQHAFAVLGKNGEIPGAREHTCSECTKPFKRTMQDTERIPGTLDVNMLTLDGVVMGPQVCLFNSVWF